ncbi:related to para-nitrobenzyl esterase [Sporisorium scitamineum]|uniref:Carboxylic ester hydrolase n=1 Tax=Sporisorium scitamineum TaxID=49012 RepID=A0A0F7S847_9BASI|nr:related to para-nitrobenzyl esterase [Sporisorium scitamineum]CDW97514.1 hypothetical protein [Sporisorium scitamineum]
MTLLSSLACLLCSLVTCLNQCSAVPIPSCPANDCIIYTAPPSPTNTSLQVTLPFGLVFGTTTDYAAHRFTLPYARPPVGLLRFSSPQPLSPFTTVYNATQLPKACMQQPDSRYGISEENISEDCLYLNIYRPAKGAVGRPVLVWVHGGSFVQGSSTAPGLDGSWLASRYNIVVVTVQYRLGMFGFFSPTGFTDESASSSSSNIQGNQGVRDTVSALQFIHDNIGSFGGNPNSVTLAGQSSGAHLIRSLLNAPSAASLFQRAILHSDPANFGTPTLKTSADVSDFALSQTDCSDLQCLRSMSAVDLLSASTTTVQAGQSIDASVAMGEVWRPFLGDLIGPAFEQDPSAATASKPIIFTNVENEGGSMVGTMLLPTGAGASSAELRACPVTMTREQLLDEMFNAGRGGKLSNVTQYGMNTNTSAYPSPARVELYSQSNDSLRRNLETVLTQGEFTCPTWFNAQRYSTKAPSYVTLFEKGIRYPSNVGNDYCQDDRVCHEDDIQLVFTDPGKVDATKREVVKEVQARWVGFATNGDPNTDKYGGWRSVGAGQQSARVLRLGVRTSGAASSVLDTISLQTAQYAACGQVWHSEIKFDWQLYG